MTDTASTPTPDSAPAAPTADAAPKPSTPPWGSDFDAQRAWDTITAQRDSEKALKDRIAAFERAEQERADADKSELDKAVARAERAEKSAKDAARTLALSKSGLPETLHAFITGDTDEVIAEQIAALTAAMKPADDAPTDQSVTDATPSRPKPVLTPGQGGEVTPTFDPSAIAATARAAA